mgnify:CR=1 FL=1
MNNEDEMTKVPYIVYEQAQVRSERRDKRFIIIFIVLTAMLFISNIVWLYAWTSYDYVDDVLETRYSQDGGFNNINTGVQGDNNYGANFDD